MLIFVSNIQNTLYNFEMYTGKNCTQCKTIYADAPGSVKLN